jgi:phosphatidylinositol dimannoside acyltransferase
MKLRERAIDVGYGAAWRLVRALPGRTAHGLFDIGADRAARRGGPGVARLAANLRVVVGPDMSEDQFNALVRAGMRSYARYWCDAFRLPSRSKEQNRAGFTLHGVEMLQADVAAGRGSVLALPHAGNWDAAGAYVAAMDLPITTVAERLQPEVVYERFLAFRRGLGMEILPLTGGERPAIDVLTERVRAGTVVPLLADRDFSRGGVAVTFFGRRTRMPAGPAILAIRTGAPLYTVDMCYEGAHPVGRISPPLTMPDPSAGSLDERVRSVTQTIADHFATSIARSPQDWHMLAPMFVPDRTERAERVAA